MATNSLLFASLLLTIVLNGNSAIPTGSKKVKVWNYNGKMLKGPEDKICPYDKNVSWSYNVNLLNGPEYWGETFPLCYGHTQSPINIITLLVKKDRNLKQLELNNYDIPLNRSTIENNGYTVKVTPADGVNRTVIVNGLIYSLNHFHFHWGPYYSVGTEHRIDNMQYSMELHLVHSNSAGQLAVVAVLYQSSSTFISYGLMPIVSSLKKIRFNGEKLDISEEIDMKKLIKNGCSFYRYIGSLTTPPCTKNIIWSICEEPLSIGMGQLNEFNTLSKMEKKYGNYPPTECQIQNNCRPAQPLYGRTVVSSA